MHKRFFASLKESPFIEGMGRIFDFSGIIERGIAPVMSDAEALNVYKTKSIFTYISYKSEEFFKRIEKKE
jgi:hypothetical protein